MGLLKAEIVLILTCQVISITHGRNGWMGTFSRMALHSLCGPEQISCTPKHSLHHFPETQLLHSAHRQVCVSHFKKKSNNIRMIICTLQLCFMDSLGWKCLPKVNNIISLKDHSSSASDKSFAVFKLLQVIIFHFPGQNSIYGIVLTVMGSQSTFIIMLPNSVFQE